MRLLPFRIVVTILALILVYSMGFTPRSWILGTQPVIAHMGPIKQPADFDLTDTLDDYGVHLVRPISPWATFMRRYKAAHGDYEPFSFGKASTPAMGYSIHEFGFFGMPFGWSTDMGDVIYVKDARETVYAQLNARGLAAVNKANGRDVTTGNWFPFWAHAWGWLWVLGVGLAIWLWFRAEAQRREELGLIG